MVLGFPALKIHFRTLKGSFKKTSKERALSLSSDLTLVAKPPPTENDLSDSTDVGFAESTA